MRWRVCVIASTACTVCFVASSAVAATGLTLVDSTRGVRIATIEPGSRARLAGLDTQDLLVVVAYADARNVSAAVLSERLERAASDVAIEVERGNERIAIVLPWSLSTPVVRAPTRIVRSLLSPATIRSLSSAPVAYAAIPVQRAVRAPTKCTPTDWVAESVAALARTKGWTTEAIGTFISTQDPKELVDIGRDRDGSTKVLDTMTGEAASNDARIGKAAPEWSRDLASARGSLPRSVEQLRGRSVLLAFMPAVSDMLASLLSLQSQYRGKLEVIGISKESVSAIRASTMSDLLNLASDETGATHAAYGVTMPSLVMIDPRGMVVAIQSNKSPCTKVETVFPDLSK